MKEELVSIIVPVYNAERFLNDTINSVLSQSYHNWELILVDDCSTDNCEKTIKNFQKSEKRIKFFKMKNNGGPALARNYGIDMAKGKYICFLDADDLWDADKLEKQVDFMEKNNCSFSYTSYEFANSEGMPTGKKVVAKEKITYDYALKNNIISTITVMFNLKIIDKDLIKMPNLKYVEDTATWWQILRTGIIAYGIPTVFSYYRRGGKSQSSNKLKTQKSLWNLYRNVENLSVMKSLYCLFWKNLHALIRRV